VGNSAAPGSHESGYQGTEHCAYTRSCRNNVTYVMPRSQCWLSHSSRKIGSTHYPKLTSITVPSFPRYTFILPIWSAFSARLLLWWLELTCQGYNPSGTRLHALSPCACPGDLALQNSTFCVSLHISPITVAEKIERRTVASLPPVSLIFFPISLLIHSSCLLLLSLVPMRPGTTRGMLEGRKNLKNKV